MTTYGFYTNGGSVNLTEDEVWEKVEEINKHYDTQKAFKESPETHEVVDFLIQWIHMLKTERGEVESLKEQIRVLELVIGRINLLIK